VASGKQPRSCGFQEGNGSNRILPNSFNEQPRRSCGLKGRGNEDERSWPKISLRKGSRESFNERKKKATGKNGKTRDEERKKKKKKKQKKRRNERKKKKKTKRRGTSRKAGGHQVTERLTKS
jgi:hypothetical protein